MNDDFVYRRKDNGDGTWTIYRKKIITQDVDLKEEYGIDFMKLWGLE